MVLVFSAGSVDLVSSHKHWSLFSRPFASQAKGRGFDPRLPLQTALKLKPGVPLGFSFNQITPMFTPIESIRGGFMASVRLFVGSDLLGAEASYPGNRKPIGQC